MNQIHKPIGTATSVAFVVISIALSLLYLAVCHKHYMRNIPTQCEIMETKTDWEKAKSEFSAYGITIPESISTNERYGDNMSESWAPSPRHISTTGDGVTQTITESLLGLIIH